MQSLKFSVVTPVLNRAHHLPRAITSVIDQRYAHVEHIVIDGGSTDGTMEVVASHPHLVAVSEPDEGCVDAMNKGIRLMTGDVFCWLNSDELYLPGTFDKIAKYFRANPDWDVIFGHYTFMDSDGREVGRCGRHRFSRAAQIAGLNWIVPSAAFVRTSALKDVGGKLDERWRDAFDHDLWIRLSERHRIAVVPDYVSSFGLHSDSGVVKHPEKALRERRLVRQFYRGEKSSVGEWAIGAYVDLLWFVYRTTKWRRMTRSASGTSNQAVK